MDMNRILNEPVKIYVDPNDNGIVNFEYPSSFTDESILRIIRLEIGALAAWTPVNEINISPYINDYYPEVLENGSTSILTTTAERKMSKMIYGDYPSFDELLEQIVKIEHVINNN